MTKIFFKHFILILFAAVIFYSCSGRYSLENKINSLENAMEAVNEPSDSILEPLLMAYTGYIRKYPEDGRAPIYLYKVGSFYVRMQNWKEAAKHFELVIDRYKDSEVYAEALLLAAYSYETIRANNEERAAVLYKEYLEKYPEGPGIARAQYYFKPENYKIRSRIAEYQNELYAEKGNLNRQTAHILVSQYMNYIKKYPQSEFSPNYCFEGGKLASTIGETLDAVEFWLTILEIYPDFRLYPETILLLAVEYEAKMPIYLLNPPKKERLSQKVNNRIKRFELLKTDWQKESEKLYKQFLKKYPNHELAEQAKASLKYLGKTPNEVVSEFKKKY